MARFWADKIGRQFVPYKLGLMHLSREISNRVFYLQSGTASASSVECTRTKHVAYSCCARIFVVLSRHSENLNLQTSSVWCHLGEACLPIGSRSGLLARCPVRTKPGKEIIHDSRVALKSPHPTLFLQMDVVSHGQQALGQMHKRNGFICGQRSQGKLYSRRGFLRSLLPSFTLVVRAVNHACVRSHLPLGIAAVMVGGINQSMLETEQSHGNVLLNGHLQCSPAILLAYIYSVLEFMVVFLRAIYLIFLFTPSVLSAPFANSIGGEFREAWLHLVRHTLELAGAAFIKWGQWAASRPDLFPRDLCLELTKLHTNAPAHKFQHTVQTVEGAFGRKLHELFEDFEEEPVASGSIAQVHKATLRFNYSGQSSKPMVVAVKVRHPGVSDVIRRDFIILNWMAGLSTLVPGLRWLRLDESVRQFAVFMLTQVDLAREAAHLSRFLYNFRNWKDVSFPKPLYPLVHPAVLVETYEEGECVSTFFERSERSSMNSALAHLGTQTFLKMLLVDNFIHADMHPGNILVRMKKKKSPSRKGLFQTRPHVIFLDVGMTAELSNKDRANLLEFFKAVALRDGRIAANCVLKFSRDQCCPNPEAFIKEIETSFKFWGSDDGDAIRPGECMQELLEQVRRHKVNVDGDICTVMVSILVLEGWQRKLDPDYNLMNTLQNVLFKIDWAKSLSYTINGIIAP